MAAEDGKSSDFNEFLKTLWDARISHSLDETPQVDGSTIAELEEGDWKMVETYTDREDGDIVISGHQVISFNGQPILASSCHATGTNVWDRIPIESFLDFFDRAYGTHQDPNFPLAAVDGTEDDNFRYSRENLLGGELTIARFVLKETIVHSSSTEVLLGYSVGQMFRQP